MDSITPVPYLAREFGSRRGYGGRAQNFPVPMKSTHRRGGLTRKRNAVTMLQETMGALTAVRL